MRDPFGLGLGWAAFGGGAAGPAPELFTVSVAASADDARETVATGVVNLTNTTSGMDADSNVGFRFQGVTIPQGATILSAAIQFTASATDAAAATIDIFAQDADDAAAFTTDAGNITGRARTTATVQWTPAGWTSGDRLAAQLTPDLSELVQEVVDRVGWVSGNNMAFIFVRAVGTRRAASFDHATLQQATITVSYLP